MSALYQLFPSLSTEEYDALKADIAKRGVIVPVVLDEQGNVLDGHHRQQAATELGLNRYPTDVRSGLSEAEKAELVTALNAHRRHLTPEKRREVIAGLLRVAPERSDRQIAAGLQVSHHTVSAVRDNLESTGQIAQLERTVGADGKERPASRLTVRSEAPRDFDRFPDDDEYESPGNDADASPAPIRPSPEPPPMSPDEAVARVLHVAGDADGSVERAVVKAAYSRALVAARELIHLKPEALAPLLDQGDFASLEMYADSLGRWVGSVRVARRPGPRLLREVAHA